MFKKAQAAMEFLMTYGWAILVVLVAIGALAYFGVLNPDKMLPEKCIISSGSGLFCDSFSVTSSAVSLKIKNSLAEPINITHITLGAAPCDNATNVEIAADGYAIIGLPCNTSDKINEDLSIVYNDTDFFQKTTSGTLVARVP